MNSVGGVIGLPITITSHQSRLTAALAAQRCASRISSLHSHQALRVCRLAFRTPAFAKLRRGRLSSSSKAVVSSKDWLNSGDNDCGDLENDGNSLTASSIVEGPFLPMRKKPDERGPYLVIKTNITMVETTNGRFRGFRRIRFSPNNEHFEFC